MFKRIKLLFSLEARIAASVNVELAKIGAAIGEIEKNREEGEARLASDLCRIRSEISGRMSKIEVLFSDELEAKEEDRDEKVRKARAKALNNG